MADLEKLVWAVDSTTNNIDWAVRQLETMKDCFEVLGLSPTIVNRLESIAKNLRESETKIRDELFAYIKDAGGGRLTDFDG